MEQGDSLAGQLRDSINSILDTNLAGPAALLASFCEVQRELDAAGGAGGHLVGWLAGEHSLQDTEAEIERLLQVCHHCFLVKHHSSQQETVPVSRVHFLCADRQPSLVTVCCVVQMDAYDALSS